MHYLHKILVHIPSVHIEEGTDRETQLKQIISHARSETECYYERAYDWREDDSAGRWEDEYPQIAYIASDDIEWFLKELEDVNATQKGSIDYSLQQLKETFGTDLAVIADKLWSRPGNNYDAAQGVTEMSAYYLRTLAQLLYGEYRCDSCFYNTNDHTARLYPSDIDMIKKNPEEWALVMFDYHY